MTTRLRLYNQMAGAVQDFAPAGDTVKIYVCGITPYDATHLGHAFTFVSFDVLIRHLQYLGYEVRYVQNVTDLDDPLFAKARELGVPFQELAAAESEQYLADMQSLNALPPDEFPRASREIPGMIQLVQELLDGGHGYSLDGTLYYSVGTDPEYGKLSRLDQQTMIELARERGGDPDNSDKHDPLDFVLWRRAASEDEPEEESPWGPGLPGWHLECSTMALKYLGAPLDIHGGGTDLIFPHHENEIAQSEAVPGGKPFARFWMHAGMVYLGGEKMSKSLGNMVFVRDLVPEYGTDALRLYISGCHYADELHYDAADLATARELAERLAEAGGVASDGAAASLSGADHRERFVERMNDNLDTPGAITVMRELAEEILAAADRGESVDEAQATLRELGGVLGLRLEQGTSGM